MNKKKCPVCGSTQTKRNGQRNGVQLYRCKDCGHQFRACRAITKEEWWEAYLNGKQTIQELSLRYKVSPSSVKRLLRSVECVWRQPDLRGAMFSLDYYLPYLFTYQLTECAGMPNTNNKIEGTFTELKKNLNNHSGMTIQNRVRFISSFFSNRL